jgi:heme-degrading monooxygenase HmoA
LLLAVNRVGIVREPVAKRRESENLNAVLWKSRDEQAAVMPYIAKTPKPPYYAVVFTSINADVDHTEHAEMYKRMVEIAEGYEGYIGIEPARNADGTGVAVIYWKDLETINAFARHPEHLVAKKKGREIWYSHYLIRICKVERDYGRP